MATAGDQYEFRTGNLWSVCNRDDVKTARKLISDDLDLEMRNKAGWTPLHAAANGGADRCVALLLDNRVARDPRCRAGHTPLVEAARNGHLATVKLLAARGADLNKTAVDSAKGTAVRNWLRGQLQLACTGGGNAKGEKRAEHQPIGASSKAKGKQLKEHRAAQKLKRAQELLGTEKQAIEQVDEGDLDVRSTRPGSTLVLDTRRRDEAEAAGGTLAWPRAAWQNVCLRAAAPATWAATSPVLRGLFRELSLPPALTGVAAPPQRLVVCFVADARHPRLHIADGVIEVLVSMDTPVVIILAKADLVSQAHVDDWTAWCRTALPAAAVVPFQNGRCLGDHRGVASRRRALHAHLTSEDKARVRTGAARLAHACGVELPPPLLDRPRGKVCYQADAGADSDGSEAGSDADRESDREVSSTLTGCSGTPTRGLEESLIATPPDTQIAISPETLIVVVGRANSGKSSVVNALVGRQAASVSHQPGHTHHVQTISIGPRLRVRDTPPIDSHSAVVCTTSAAAKLAIVTSAAATLSCPDATERTDRPRQADRPVMSDGREADGRAKASGPVVAGGEGVNGEEAGCWAIINTSIRTETVDQAADQAAGAGEMCPAQRRLALEMLSGLHSSASVRSPYSAVQLLGACVDLCRLYGMQLNELRDSGEDADELSPYGFCCALAAKKGYRQSRSGKPDPHRAALLVIRDCAQGAVPWASDAPAL